MNWLHVEFHTDWTAGDELRHRRRWHPRQYSLINKNIIPCETTRIFNCYLQVSCAVCGSTGDCLVCDRDTCSRYRIQTLRVTQHFRIFFQNQIEEFTARTALSCWWEKDRGITFWSNRRGIVFCALRTWKNRTVSSGPATTGQIR